MAPTARRRGLRLRLREGESVRVIEILDPGRGDVKQDLIQVL